MERKYYVYMLAGKQSGTSLLTSYELSEECEQVVHGVS